jgi:hypothetical protein
MEPYYQVRSGCPRLVSGIGQFGVVSRCSTNLGGRTPPILPWANDRNLIDSLHVQQITIDADEQRTLSADCRAQDWYIRRISAHVRGQICGYDNYGHPAKKCGDLISFPLREAEFLRQLSSQFLEYEFGGHQVMMQKQIFQQLGAHARAADVSRDQHRRIERNHHFFCRASKTSSSVLIPPACARATNLVRNVRNSATRR